MFELLTVTLFILIILIIVGIIIAFIVWKKKKERKYEEPDYRAFFIMGICFIPLGLIFTITVDNPGFIGITGFGLIYMAIGLANRDKWKKT